MTWFENLIKEALKTTLKDKEVISWIGEIVEKWLEENKPIPPEPPIPPKPPDPPKPPIEEKIVVADLDLIPDRMRAQGFGPASDNAMWFALAHVMAIGGVMPDDGAGSLVTLNTQRAEIEVWFEGEIAKVKKILENNLKATATAITNDGRDRCGFRLGPVIMDRLSQFGDRVQLGVIVPESEY